MSHDDAPPLEAVVGLAVMLAAWPLVMRLMWTYTFNSECVQIYFFGIPLTRIDVREIESARTASLFDVISGITPYPPKRWRTRMRLSSLFRNVVVIKTRGERYWCLTPKNSETAIDSLLLSRFPHAACSNPKGVE